MATRVAPGSGPDEQHTREAPYDYVMVAAATGVSVLALAQPSEAEIVYTATNQVLNSRNLVPVDFNNDGVTDMSFHLSSRGYGSALFVEAGQNRFMNGYSAGQVLPWGKRIGPVGSFGANNVFLAGAPRARGRSSGSLNTDR